MSLRLNTHVAPRGHTMPFSARSTARLKSALAAMTLLLLPTMPNASCPGGGVSSYEDGGKACKCDGSHSACFKVTKAFVACDLCPEVAFWLYVNVCSVVLVLLPCLLFLQTSAALFTRSSSYGASNVCMCVKH